MSTPNPLQTSSVMSDQVTYRLAAELAAKLYSLPDIMEKFGLSKVQLTKIITDPHFRTIYQEARAIWEGSDNVRERIRTKAALLLEDSVLPIYSIVHNPDLVPAARIEAFAKLMAISDMQPTKQMESSANSDKFTLNITIGDEKQTVVIESGVVPDDPEPVAIQGDSHE